MGVTDLGGLENLASLSTSLGEVMPESPGWGPLIERWRVTRPEEGGPAFQEFFTRTSSLLHLSE